MAHWPIAGLARPGMGLAICLLLVTPCVAAEASDCALAALRIEIRSELRPMGPKPVLLITVPEPEEPPHRP